MRIRHRVPSIFNLSMVDVLCCALGCVILLWLVNLREARQRTEQAGAVQKDLDAARAELTELRQEAGALKGRLATASQQAESNLAQYKAAAAELTATAAEARAARAARDDLKARLAASARRVDALELQARDQEALAGVHARRVDELGKQLTDSESRIKELRSLADLVPGLRAETKSYRDKLQAEEALAQALEKEVRKRTEQATEKSKSLVEVTRAKIAAENRFAGLALTGRRVVFLVDMSGSMELADERTVAPGKWQGVRDTLAQIMRSLPDLQKFQVIIFAEKTSYLLGQDERWLDYDPRTSVDQVREALARIKPHGGTNMYSAFEAAFRMRPGGLDTVYLFSDGLPNLGAGLTPEAARTMKEVEQNAILGRHIRTTLKTTWNRDLPGQSRVRINAIGFFYESPDVGAFLWALTRENDAGFVGMSKP